MKTAALKVKSTTNIKENAYIQMILEERSHK